MSNAVLGITLAMGQEDCSQASRLKQRVAGYLARQSEGWVSTWEGQVDDLGEEPVEVEVVVVDPPGLLIHRGC